MDFKLNGEYIKLDQLLKAANVVSSGGEAKIMIIQGEIYLNGEKEERRGKKIYRGDNVTGENINITVI